MYIIGEKCFVGYGYIQINVCCVDGFEFLVELVLESVQMLDGEIIIVFLCDILECVCIEEELCEVCDLVLVGEKVKFEFFVVMSYEIWIFLNGFFGNFMFLGDMCLFCEQL